MALGGFFKAVGKGARAVGRGAMKGVLGFDDRDIRRKFGRGEEEEVEEGVMGDDAPVTSPRKANWERPEVESDGFDVEEMDIETPADIGMTGMESLIDAGEMPELPGFKARGKGRGTRAGGGMVSLKGSGQPGGVQIEEPRATPSAYETVTAGQKANYATMPGFTADSMPGIGKPEIDHDQMLLADIRQRGLTMSDDPRAPKNMSDAGYNAGGALMGAGALAAGAAAARAAIPGLMRAPAPQAAKEAVGKVRVPRKPGVPKPRTPKPTGPYNEPGGPPGTQYPYEAFPGRGGSPPADMYPALRGRPMPGPGGVESPYPPLPPGVSQFKNGKIRYSGPM